MPGAGGGGAPGDCSADASARSPIPLRGQVALRFTFSCYVGMLRWDAPVGGA